MQQQKLTLNVLNQRTNLVVIESKKVYEMERNNLGMMYQYGLEVGLI